MDLLRTAGCVCRGAEVLHWGSAWSCSGCSAVVRDSLLSKEVEQGVDAECHYCGRRGVELTKDHVVPRLLLDLGRGEGVRNIVLACKKCNGRKGSERSSCRCRKCMWAWRKWGPDGWEKWSTWSPKVVYRYENDDMITTRDRRKDRG